MDPTDGTHRGIEIRARLLTCPPGQQEILRTDSDALHFTAEIGGAQWVQTLPPILDGQGVPWLLIEHRPALLVDEYPDD